MSFEEFECTVCDESFVAHPAGNAVDGPYCSPKCESVGMGYTELFDRGGLVDHLVENADSVGEVTAERVVGGFDSVEQVLVADREELVEITGIGDSTADRIVCVLEEIDS